jgi:toxin CptA
MSIAASVVVRPSLCLRLLQAGLCASVLAVGLLLRQPLLLLALVAAPPRKVNPCRIDVSGYGHIRLTVYQQTCRAVLLPGCTVWPWLMLLHLEEEGGRRRWLAILPDSAPAAARRRLAVAVLALAEKA